MVDFTDVNEQKLGIESLPHFRDRITDFFHNKIACKLHFLYLRALNLWSIEKQ